MLSEPSVPCSEFRVQGLQPMDLVYDIFFNPEPWTLNRSTPVLT
jgi:hypothetical protein